MNITIDTAVIFIFSAFVLVIGLLFERTGKNLKSFFAGGEGFRHEIKKILAEKATRLLP